MQKPLTPSIQCAVGPGLRKLLRQLAWANVTIHKLVAKPVPPTMLVHMRAQLSSTSWFPWLPKHPAVEHQNREHRKCIMLAQKGGGIAWHRGKSTLDTAFPHRRHALGFYRFLKQKPLTSENSLCCRAWPATNCCDNWPGQMWRSTALSPNLCLQQCVRTCKRNIVQLINSHDCPNVQTWKINQLENTRRIMLTHKGWGIASHWGRSTLETTFPYRRHALGP